MRRRTISLARVSSATGGRGERGLTLVELLIVLAILSVVAGAIFSVFLTSLRAYWKGSLTSGVQQGGRVAFDRLGREIRAGRRLLPNGTNCNGAACPGGFVFNLGGAGCAQAAPQISFVLPHMGIVSLQNGALIYATDPNGVGVIPYDGWYVSYYLAAGQTNPQNITPNTTGPYLERTVYDLNANTLTTTTVAGPEGTGAITGLGAQISPLTFTDRSTGTCPTTASRDIIVTVTASQQATGQALSDTAVFTGDVSLRNQ